MKEEKKIIGYTCSYTPLAIIDAAGFKPYRILPMGDCPDQAGTVLHDNLCPCVKRILDRCMSRDIPDIFGMVFINSCDAMRRLYDAWGTVRPDDKNVLIDLPANMDEKSISFFTGELEIMKNTISEWSGDKISESSIEESIKKFNELYDLLFELREKVKGNEFPGGAGALQAIYNKAAVEPVEKIVNYIKQNLNSESDNSESSNGVPIYLFGNVLPDPEIFSLFKSSGASIISEDLCTGSRIIPYIDLAGNDPVLHKLSRSIINSPACARTFNHSNPGHLSDDVLDKVKTYGAKGVIAHTLKFCDPYLSRFPDVRETLKKEGIPFLLLEGDCTLRSIGQHRTRIEAFIEMLA